MLSDIGTDFNGVEATKRRSYIRSNLNLSLTYDLERPRLP
jgi:hypothetical protein